MQGPLVGGDFLLALLRLELTQQAPEALPTTELRRLFEVNACSDDFMCTAPASPN